METQTIVKNSQVQTRQDENTTQKVFTRRFYRSFSGIETLQKTAQVSKGQAFSNFDAKIAVKEQEDTNKPYSEKAEKANLVCNNVLESTDEPNQTKNLAENIFEKAMNGAGLKTEANNTQSTTRELPKSNSLNDLYFEPVSLKDFKQLEKIAKLLELANSKEILGSEDLDRLKKEISLENSPNADYVNDRNKVVNSKTLKHENVEQKPFVTPPKYITTDTYPVSDVVANTVSQKEATETVENDVVETVKQTSKQVDFLPEQTDNNENNTNYLSCGNSQLPSISLSEEVLTDENSHPQENAEETQQNEVVNTVDECEQSLEADEENEIGGKHYSAAQDFGKLSTIFRDRRPQYQAYIFFIIVASVSAVTLTYKFSLAGLGGISNFVSGYLSYAKTLGDGFWDTAIFGSPFLLTSLVVYFGGYTLFAKVLSAIWMIASGFAWGLFAAASYSVLDTTQMIFFCSLSAVLLFTCVLFAAEAGKYSALNTFGRAELIKPSNIRQFTFVYIVYCVAIMIISVIMLRYIF